MKLTNPWPKPHSPVRIAIARTHCFSKENILLKKRHDRLNNKPGVQQNIRVSAKVVTQRANLSSSSLLADF